MEHKRWVSQREQPRREHNVSWLTPGGAGSEALDQALALAVASPFGLAKTAQDSTRFRDRKTAKQDSPGRSANHASGRHTSERGLLIKNQGLWRGWSLTSGSGGARAWNEKRAPGFEKERPWWQRSLWVAGLKNGLKWFNNKSTERTRRLLNARARRARPQPKQHGPCSMLRKRSADNVDTIHLVASVVESTPFYRALISLPRRRLQGGQLLLRTEQTARVKRWWAT